MSDHLIAPSVEDLKKIGIEIPTTGKVVLDIFTEWCGPCKSISPVLHKLKDEGVITLVQEDLDKNRPLAEQFHIHSIPTLLFFKDGKRIGDVGGGTDQMPLAEFFSKVSTEVTFTLVKDGNDVTDLSSYGIKIKKMLIKDGVMVGFPGEEVLTQVVKDF